MRATGAASHNGSLPCLAVPHSEDSVDPMAIAEAASGLCELVWVIDSREPGMATSQRLLARLGTVVDVSGCTEDEAIARVAATRPSGAVPFTDKAIPLAAALAARLGLAGTSPEQASRFVDKADQRRLLADKGLDVPACFALRPDALDTGAGVPAGTRFPLIVKPRRGSGSRHTFAASDADDLVRKLGAERAAGMPLVPGLVAEELLVGADAPGTAFADYVSAELAADGHEVACLALTGRLPVAEPFRETGLFVPSDLGRDDAAEVAALAIEAATALGAPAGCYHVEIKLTPHGPRVIEVNGRLGGTVPDLLRLACGFSLLRLAMRLALGERLAGALEGRATPLRLERVTFRSLVQPPIWAASLEGIDGLETLQDVAAITEVATHRTPGSRLDWREGTEGYVVRVTGTADSHRTLGECLELIDGALRIHYGGRADGDGQAATGGDRLEASQLG